MKALSLSFTILGSLCIVVATIGWIKWGISHDTLIIIGLFWGIVMFYMANQVTDKIRNKNNTGGL